MNHYLIKIASALGMLQGFTWFILALASCFVYGTQPDMTATTFSYSYIIKSSLYQQFIFSPSASELPPGFIYKNPVCPDCIVTAKVFLGLMIGVLIVNFVWASSSEMLYRHCSRAEKHHPNALQNWIKIWTVITPVVIIWDLIVFIMLLADFSLKCTVGKGEVYPLINGIQCFLSTGIAMTIAARGFVLLAVNGAFVVVLYTFSKRTIQ